MPQQNSIPGDEAARDLGRLLGTVEADPGDWTDADLADIFAHQMAAPVEFDLGGLTPQSAATMRLLSAARGLLVRSLHDLLHHPQPPTRLLEMTKDLAKACRNDPCGPLPAPVATALYYCTIGVARLRCERRISHLDDAALADGLAWVVRQTWVDAQTRALAQQILAQLRR